MGPLVVDEATGEPARASFMVPRGEFEITGISALVEPNDLPAMNLSDNLTSDVPAFDGADRTRLAMDWPIGIGPGTGFRPCRPKSVAKPRVGNLQKRFRMQYVTVPWR